MKMRISCFGTKIKPRKTMYILKGNFFKITIGSCKFTFDVFAKHLNRIKLSLKHTSVLTVDLTYCKQTYMFQN